MPFFSPPGGWYRTGVESFCSELRGSASGDAETPSNYCQQFRTWRAGDGAKRTQDLAASGAVNNPKPRLGNAYKNVVDSDANEILHEGCHSKDFHVKR